MTDSKTYLNVPYAEKDEAKALGARWDPVNKKWYVPAGKDIASFSRWQLDDESLANFTPKNSRQVKPNPTSKPTKISSNQAKGVFTYPNIENFIAYSGDTPPWD